MSYILLERKENRDYALKYLFEEVINIEDNDFVERYDANLFIENDLFGLLKNYFEGSPYKVLDYYFEGKIKPWHLKQGPKNYFKSKENRINAVKWLIEEELKWSEEDVIKGWCNELLLSMELIGLLSTQVEIVIIIFWMSLSWYL